MTNQTELRERLDGAMLAESIAEWRRRFILDLLLPIITAHLEAETKMLREALKEIRDRGNQYDHPPMNSPMHQGPYGAGVADGHRVCAAIARTALANAQNGEKG